MLQYMDKVVDVPGDAVARERISHIFNVLLALFTWILDLISLSPLFWQPLAPVRCDSPRMFLGEFRLFST